MRTPQIQSFVPLLFIFLLFHFAKTKDCTTASSCILIPFQQIESLEAQLSDELADRSKATETISALQVRAMCWALLFLITKNREESA